MKIYSRFLGLWSFYEGTIYGILRPAKEVTPQLFLN